MPIKIVTDQTVKSGNEPMIERAVQHLERNGIDRRNVRSIVITAEVGQPLILDVSLYVALEPADDVLPVRVGPSDAWGEQ